MTLSPHNMTVEEMLTAAYMSTDPLVRRMYSLLCDFYEHVNSPEDIDELRRTIDQQDSDISASDHELAELNRTLRDWRDKDLKYVELERELSATVSSAHYFQKLAVEYQKENTALLEKIKTWTILST